MHICVSFDSASGVTAADRIKMFVNGVEVTSLSASTSTPTDETTAFNANVLHEIGRYSFNGGDDANVSLAQFCMIENKSFQNSDLAITDLLDSFTFGTSGSQFGPKANSDLATLCSAAGSESFCLDFADSGGTGAANLGNDISSKESDFAPQTMSAANQSSNTPSLAYQTFNPLWKSNSSFTLTEGNTKANLASGGGILPLTKTIGGNEKVYAEFVATDANNSNFALGIAKDNIAMNSAFRATGIIGWESDGDKYTDGSQTGTDVRSWADGAVMALALDMENRKLWIRDSTGWQGSAGTDDPETSSTGVALPSSVVNNAYIIFRNSAG